MNDEQFEAVLDLIRRSWNSGGSPVADLRACDTAQREALARVEADGLKQWQAGRDGMRDERDAWIEKCQQYRAQLAEAVGLLRKARRYVEHDHPDGIHSYQPNSISGDLLGDLDVLLARHAQAEQQEAREPVLARPEHGVSMDQALALTMDRYSGAMEKLAASEQQEAQGAQAGDERSKAEQAYVEDAFDYSAAPVGSRDWTLYWKGWKARAALATQPAAGEPIHQWADQDLWMDGDEADMASARAEGFKTRTLWNAPPAAAHGDEAVRKDAERYRWLRDYWIGDDPASINMDSANRRGLNAAIDAAMRAQGDGEVQ